MKSEDVGAQAQLLVDVNMLPSIALQRIEVLRDGAAATYGSDAIAGVMNFITRGDFEGFEITGSSNIGYCPGGVPLAYADSKTDLNGYTAFSGALGGGGFLSLSDGHLRIYVKTGGKFVPITGTKPAGGDVKSILPFTLTSVDIVPDGQIDLGDIAEFSKDLGTATPRSDFNQDGAVDLGDIGFFARHLAHGCD